MSHLDRYIEIAAHGRFMTTEEISAALSLSRSAVHSVLNAGKVELLLARSPYRIKKMRHANRITWRLEKR